MINLCKKLQGLVLCLCMHFITVGILDFPAGEVPPTLEPSPKVSNDEGVQVPSLWVVIIALIASTLLVLNISAVICIIRRRRRRKRGGTPPVRKHSSNHHNSSKSNTMNTNMASGHSCHIGKFIFFILTQVNSYYKKIVGHICTGQPLMQDRELLMNQVLGARGDWPKLMIIIVATVGTFIVILNIALVICLVRRKQGRKIEDGIPHFYFVFFCFTLKTALTLILFCFFLIL